MTELYNTLAVCTTVPNHSFEQVQEATRKLVERAAMEPPGQRRTILLLDLPTGAGKTYSALRLKLLAAAGGTHEALMQPRHALMQESAETCSDIAAQLGVSGAVNVVLLAGKGRLCLHPEGHEDARARGDNALTGICDDCTDKQVCPYRLQFEEAARPNTLVLAPHGMAQTLARRGLAGQKLWYDEVPKMWEEVELSLKDITTFLGDIDVSPYPEEVRCEAAQYFEVRKEAAAFYARLISELSRKARCGFCRKVYFGPYLRKCIESDALANALVYDPTVGTAPITEFGSSQPWPRREFDLFQAPLLALLKGKGSIRDGAVGVYVDPSGDSGLILQKRKLLAPMGHNCVVMAAGISHLQPILESLYPEWDIVAERVEATPPSHTEILGYKYSRFSSRYLVLDVDREDALRNTLLRLLSKILGWGARKGRGKLVAALVCPKKIADDVRKGFHEKLLNIYSACGVELLVESVEHYGNLDGSNRFSTVDVWIMLGQQMPNLSMLNMLSHSLQIPGEESLGLEQLFGAYHYEQNFGRPRPFSRTAGDPLLIIEVRSGERRWGEKASSWAGQPPKLKTVLYESLVEVLLVFEKECSAPMMKQLYEALSSVESGIGPCGIDKITSQDMIRLGGLLSLINDKGRSQKFDDRYARKVLKRLSKEKAMIGGKQRNRLRTGSSTRFRFDPLEGTYNSAAGTMMLGGCQVFDTFEQFLSYGHKEITDFEDYRVIRILEIEEAILNLTDENLACAEDYPWNSKCGERYAEEQSIRCRAEWNKRLLEHHGLDVIYRRVELPFAMLLLKMNQYGLPISAETLESYVGSGRLWVEQVLKESRASSGRVRSVYTWSPFGGVYAKAPISHFLEKNLRHVVRAPEGSVLMELDYRAYQPSMLGYLSGDQFLLECTESRAGLNTILADCLLPGKKLTGETVKGFVLPLINGCTVETLAEKLGLGIHEIELMVETFWGTLFPDAFEYLEGVRAEADKYPHIVRTPFLGRLGWFPAIPLDDSSLQWERWRASSFMMQGSCATFFKMMSVVLHRKLPRGARIILTIYDAVLLEVPLNLVQDVAFLCKSTMRRPTGFKGVLKVRTRVGPSWGEMEELKPTWSSRSSR